MKSFSYVITDEVGLHARPAGLLVKEVKKYSSKVMVSAKGRSTDATKLMTIMSMGIKKGDEVTITVEGGEEESEAVALEKFFIENL